ncbi:adenosine receptor A3-like [Montipora capricornis]|uniref:adenosine receptor A3-like n=1 Tax=Montipora capricornis TaxID=246305 RepID=UPI0035F19C17
MGHNMNVPDEIANHTDKMSYLGLTQDSTCPLLRRVVPTVDFAGTSAFAISCLNIPLSLSGFLGNLIILIALRRSTSINAPTKLLFLNLAFTDLCVGFICQPLFSLHLMFISLKRWDLCGVTEKAGYIPTVSLCGVSLLTVTAISVDRLLVLLKGMIYRKVVTLKRVRILLAIIWISSLCTGVSFLWNVRVFFGMICFFVLNCLVISTSSYVTIFLIFRRQREKVRDELKQQPEQTTPPVNAARRYEKSVSTALWIYVALITCYLPFSAIKLVTTFVSVTPSLLVVNALMATLVYFNSTLNPALYCWKIKEIRRRVRGIVCRIKDE